MQQAEEYLEEIQKLDNQIQFKSEEIYRLRCLATSVTAPTDREAVNSSGITDRVGENAPKIADLSNEIEADIDALIDAKNERINAIESSVKNALQYRVLYKRYVQYKQMTEITAEEHYSYQHIIDTKGAALKRVQSYLDREGING